ncbi:hypothetical protein ES332_D03G119500v1 [Gossypium tomentosum]|uniref:Uncharacterized protein n=1 Tax=Gossypium tomentosum TaxID=34277 RepID=A0A5D2LQ71_GOSTO|nr:hypothetical protein ES332_D03G119500v1 [Gossypium tomentosum]
MKSYVERCACDHGGEKLAWPTKQKRSCGMENHDDRRKERNEKARNVKSSRSQDTTSTILVFVQPIRGGIILEGSKERLSQRYEFLSARRKGKHPIKLELISDDLD